MEINQPGKFWTFYNELVKACKKCAHCGKIDFLDFECICGQVSSFLLKTRIINLYRLLIAVKVVSTQIKLLMPLNVIRHMILMKIRK